MKGTEGLRVSVQFHGGNQDEERAYRYIQEEKRKGISYVSYITRCVLEHEEGAMVRLSKGDLDDLADILCRRIEEGRKPAKENKVIDIN